MNPSTAPLSAALDISISSGPPGIFFSREVHLPGIRHRKRLWAAAAVAFTVHGILALTLSWMNMQKETVHPLQPIQVSLVVPPHPVVTAVPQRPKPVVKQTPLSQEVPLPSPLVEPVSQPEEPVTTEEAASVPSASEAMATAEPPPIVPPLYHAAYLNNPIPAYPLAAKRQGIQGTVFLRVRVSPSGLPIHIELSRSSGSPVLDRSALQAVRGWTFIPARQGNEPVTATVEIPIYFRLSS